jgi:hypothetical protein
MFVEPASDRLPTEAGTMTEIIGYEPIRFTETVSKIFFAVVLIIGEFAQRFFVIADRIAGSLPDRAC